MNNLICGDAISVLNKMRPKSIDLVVTSPPYDNLRDYKGYSFDSTGIIKGLYRVLKPGGVVVWVVGDATIGGSETGTSFKQALAFMNAGFLLHDTMIYQKTNFSNPSLSRYHQIFEYMFIFSSGKPKTFNSIKDKKNLTAGKTCFGVNTQRLATGEIRERGTKSIVSEYGQRGNVWLLKTASQENPCKKNLHPAQFPLQLAIDHIISWSNPGDLVLDPMCGSGTTGVAATDLGRNFIGVDISSEYIKLAARRIAEAQGKLNARP